MNSLKEWVGKVVYMQYGDDIEERRKCWVELDEFVGAISEKSLIDSLISEEFFAEILFQHVLLDMFLVDNGIWKIAMSCLLKGMKYSPTSVLQTCEIELDDLLKSMFQIADTVVYAGCSDQNLLVCYFLALMFISFLMPTNFTADGFMLFSNHFIDLLEKLQTLNRNMGSQAEFMFRMMSFAMVNEVRMVVARVRERNTLQEFSKHNCVTQLIEVAPMGVSLKLMESYNAPKMIKAFPGILMAVLSCHSAVCLIPKPLILQSKDKSVLALDPVKTYLRGAERHEERIAQLLFTSYNMLHGGSWELSDKQKQDLLRSVVAIVCSEGRLCSAMARYVLLALLHCGTTPSTSAQRWLSKLENLHAIEVGPSLSHIVAFAGKPSYQKTDHYILVVALFQGMHLAVQDLAKDNYLLADESSKTIARHTEEAIVAGLQYVFAEIGNSVLDSNKRSQLQELLQPLREILTNVAMQTRVTLLHSTYQTVQRGVNQRIEGCSALLHANENFIFVDESATASSYRVAAPPPATNMLTANIVPSVKPPTSNVGAKNSAVPSRPATVMLDILRKDSSSGTLDKYLTVTKSTITKPPLAPAKSGGDSYLDQLEEQEAEWVDGRSVGQKRMRDLSSAGFGNAERSSGSNKRQATDSRDGGWKNQLEELRKQKELTRQKMEAEEKKLQSLKQDSATSKMDCASATASSAAPVAKSKPRMSSLLQSMTANDDTDSDKAAPQCGSKAGGSTGNSAKFDLFKFIASESSNSNSSGGEKAGSKENYLYGKYNFENLPSQWANQLEAGQTKTAFLSGLADPMTQVNIDPVIAQILKFNLSQLAAMADTSMTASMDLGLVGVPVRFLHEEQYISIFQPLLIEEIKASIGSFLVNGGTSGGIKERYRKSSGGEQQAQRRAADKLNKVYLRCVGRSEYSAEQSLEELRVSVMKNRFFKEDAMAVAGPNFSHHMSDRDPVGYLSKDDLVMILSEDIQQDLYSWEDLIKREYVLGLVVSAPNRSNNSSASKTNTNSISNELSSGGNSGANDNIQKIVIAEGSLMRDKRSIWTCISVMGLSPALREFLALHSIRSHKLMPLAPYLLKGSPVISAENLSSKRDRIASGVESIAKAVQMRAPEERLAKLNEVLIGDLLECGQIQIDGSVLKNTGIAKALMKLCDKNQPIDGVSSQVGELAEALVAKWKEQIKNDNKVSTIRNMKGGKVLETPTQIAQPKGVASALWRRLTSLYNNSQLHAIKYVSDQFEGTQDTRIALVQGPPGTGKTSTILGMVAALLHRTTVSEQRQRLLICAPSNAAIDEILTRLTYGVYDSTGSLRKIKVVRLGEPLESASDLIRSLTVDAQVEEAIMRHSSSTKLVEVVENIRRIEKELAGKEKKVAVKDLQFHAVDANKDASGKEVLELRNQLAGYRRMKRMIDIELERQRAYLRKTILNDADVVSATLSSSGRQFMLDHVIREEVSFDTAIIDEAAQSTEPATLIPLRFGCRRLVLVGDPRQLPATVLSTHADRAGLGMSLFERLEKAEHEVVMLTIQYRMHPEIRKFPSQQFYQNLLVDADEIVNELKQHQESANAMIVEGAEEASGDNNAMVRAPSKTNIIKSSVLCRELLDLGISPVLFLNTTDELERKVGTSIVNDGEVAVIRQLLVTLLSRLPENLSVALITPYKAQVRQLRDSLFRDCKESLFTLQQRRRAAGNEIEVNTIDGFQGREKDVVFFSCVRSRPTRGGNEKPASQGAIGFVADERRVNVALTRAKKSLFIVGNSGTLRRDPLWSALIESLKTRNCIVEVPALKGGALRESDWIDLIRSKQ